MRKIGMALAAMLLLAVTGCGLFSETKKIPSEDIDVLIVFASEIATLHDTSLPPGSKEKFEAAKRLLEGVDFSYTRNVRTLDNIFGASDVKIATVDTTSEYLIFQYTYGGSRVMFSFARTNNAVTASEVGIDTAL